MTDVPMFDTDAYQTRPWLHRERNAPPAPVVADNDGGWVVVCRPGRPPHPYAHRIDPDRNDGTMLCGLRSWAIAVEGRAPVHPCPECLAAKEQRAATSTMTASPRRNS